MIFFTLVCEFLSPKFTFLCLFCTSFWLFVTSVYVLWSGFIWMFQGWWNTILWGCQVIYHYWKNLKQNGDASIFKTITKNCFLWSILASLHPAQHGNNQHRVSKYQECEHELIMSGIKYPVDIKNMSKFEHSNNISDNGYGYEDKKMFPLCITTVTTARHHIKL